MRAVLHGDVVAAACVLLALPDTLRAKRLDRMLDEAAAADLYRKKTGKGHPAWGNGSLMAAALHYPARAEPFLDDVDYCRCMALVFEALVERRCRARAISHGRR